MKKSLLIISALCLYLGASSKAPNSTSIEHSGNIKDTSSIVNGTRAPLAIDSAYTVHPIEHRREVRFGFKAGVNKSDVYNGLSESKAEPLMGWVAGAFVSIPLNRLFGFQPELLYAEKGFKAMGTVGGNNYDFERKTSYIDVPLLLQFKPTKCISLFAGPLVSFLVQTKDLFDAGPITNEQKQVIANGVIHKNILGAEAGADVYIQNVVASIRAGWDLQDINDNAPSNSRRYQNSWIQVTVGYVFK